MTIEDSAGLQVFKPFVKYRENAPTAYIFGREIHVIGMNDARAESKIRGMTVLLAYVDEITVLPEDAYKQLLGRMSLDESRLFGTTNPDSPAHWFKTDFLDRLRKLEGWRRWHFTMDDNPILSEAKKAQYRAQYTGLWYKRFIEGAWVAAEGAIFDMWDPAKHVIPSEETPNISELFGVGIDYGTVHPSAALLLGLTKGTKADGYKHRLILIDEWRYVGRQEGTGTLAPPTQAELLLDWLDKPHLPENNIGLALKPRFKIVDSAVTHFAREIELRGETTHLAVKNVGFGVSMMASLLAEGNLQVTDRCEGFIQEAPGYAWNPQSAPPRSRRTRQSQRRLIRRRTIHHRHNRRPMAKETHSLEFDRT